MADDRSNHALSWAPNAFTLLRAVLAVLVGFSLVAWEIAAPRISAAASIGAGDGVHPLAAAPFALFLLAALTDLFDGMLARRLNAVSAFGAWLDPIADKLLVASALVGLCHVSGWAPALVAPTLVILSRDIAISAFRAGPAGATRLPVSGIAKWKTALELVAIGGLLALLALGSVVTRGEESVQGKGLTYARTASVALLWLAAAFSLYTAWDYVWRLRQKAAEDRVKAFD